MHNILAITKREYLKIVRKRSFWASVLLLPTFYIILSVIMGMTSQSVEKKVAEEAKNAKKILVVDETGYLGNALIMGAIERSTSLSEARAAVIAGNADAAFVYGSDLRQTKKIQVYAQETSLVSRGRFDQLAVNLLKQSILLGVNDQEQIALFNADLKVSKTLYKGDKEVAQGIESLIVPIVSVVVYFLLVMLASSYMLMSVSEEKENRMIETMLSIVSSRDLILGKMIALIGVAFTQLITLGVFGAAAFFISSNFFPLHIDWSLVHVTVGQALTALFYVVTGFIFISSVMVGVGASMPTYREAQQFSAIFIILSILPIYVASALVAEPAGLLARVFSYFPFTAPLVLLFRSSIDALPGWEVGVGMTVMLLYICAGLLFAFKLFELGSLELTKKISLSSILRSRK